MPQVKSGQIVPLVIYGERRSVALPNVPTIYEVGVKDFPAGGWYGLKVPKGTPKEAVNLVNAKTKIKCAVKRGTLHWPEPPCRLEK